MDHVSPEIAFCAWISEKDWQVVPSDDDDAFRGEDRFFYIYPQDERSLLIDVVEGSRTKRSGRYRR